MLALRPILVAAGLGLALGSVALAENEPRRGEGEPAPRRIRGRVLDANGWPLPGARISALRRGEGDVDTRGNRPILETSTDAEGRFALDALDPGSYQIDIEAPGHQATHVGVHLPEAAAPVLLLEAHLWPLTTQSPLAPIAPLPSAAVRSVGESITPREPEPDVVATVPEPTGTVAPGGLGDEVTQALAAGRVLQARALLELVDGADAADAGTFYAVGEALLRWGQTAAAVAVLDGALARDPRHVEARYRRALGLLALGRREEARKEFERVLERCREGPLAEGARTALAELDPARPSPR